MQAPPDFFLGILMTQVSWFCRRYALLEDREKILGLLNVSTGMLAGVLHLVSNLQPATFNIRSTISSFYFTEN